MKFTASEYAQIVLKWPDPYADSYDAAVKIVYGWVKQDKITPAQMQVLIVDAYKHFIY